MDTDFVEFERAHSGAADCASLRLLAVEEDRPAAEHQLLLVCSFVANRPRCACLLLERTAQQLSTSCTVASSACLGGSQSAMSLMPQARARQPQLPVWARAYFSSSPDSFGAYVAR